MNEKKDSRLKKMISFTVMTFILVSFIAVPSAAESQTHICDDKDDQECLFSENVTHSEVHPFIRDFKSNKLYLLSSGVNEAEAGNFEDAIIVNSVFQNILKADFIQLVNEKASSGQKSVRISANSTVEKISEIEWF